MFVSLSALADVRLGFKSLQNEFFYVNQHMIDSYHIEPEFLTPIVMLNALNARAYLQEPCPSTWLFNCRDRREDLRGTGALEYIEVMAGRSATRKRQAGKNLTIREALEAQGGANWYSPKARPREHQIWVRKGIGSIFAPYLFVDSALVDQRCNSISPAYDVGWQELAAALTSTLFAYSVEINGASSLGAGALEAATTKLRRYPVLDIRALSGTDRSRLVVLAEAVWSYEPPVDWAAESSRPGRALQELDEWLLTKSKSGVSLSTVYQDLRAVCFSRIAMARDKGKRKRKHKADSINSVANSIAKAIEPKLRVRRFPEDFVKGNDLDVRLNFERGSIGRISASQLLDRYSVTVVNKTGRTVFEEEFMQPVAEVIVRSLLFGRSTFSVSSDRAAMAQAVSSFIAWIEGIEGEIDRRVAESSLGTGYEEVLKGAVFEEIGLHRLTGTKVLPNEIIL